MYFDENFKECLQCNYKCLSCVKTKYNCKVC